MMSTAGIRRLVVGNIVSHKNQVKTDSRLRGLRAATPQTFRIVQYCRVLSKVNFG